MVSTIVASDYAVLDVGNYKFYYGYEETANNNEGAEEWAFVAKKGNRELMRLGTSQLTLGPDQFDVTANLLAGLGMFIANHTSVP